MEVKKMNYTYAPYALGVEVEGEHLYGIGRDETEAGASLRQSILLFLMDKDHLDLTELRSLALELPDAETPRCSQMF